MKRILALLLCLCLLPLYAQAEKSDAFLGTWVLEKVREGTKLIPAADYLDDGSTVMMSVEEGVITFVQLHEGGAFTESTVTWYSLGSIGMGDNMLFLLQNDGRLSLSPDGMEGDLIFRPAAEEECARLNNRRTAAGLRDQEFLLGQSQAPVNGTSAPRLTAVTVPDVPMLYGVSPSGRYVFGTKRLRDQVLVNRETGHTTPITFSADRSAPGAAMTQEALEDGFLHGLKKVAWSPDERYAALVYSGSAKDNALCDLYVLDTATGEIFAPAVWSKNRKDDHFGLVQDAAFAPDGRLYFLLETSGAGSLYFGPTILYTCEMSTGALTAVKELPASSASYPCLTCTANGDVLAIVQTDEGYSLLEGAQQENPRQIAIPAVYDITSGKDDRLVLEIFDNNVGAGSTVSFLDLSQPDTALITGLVVSAGGWVSQLPLLTKPYKEVPAGQMVFERWREIRMGMKEGAYLSPRAAAFSPDGTQVLLACSNAALFLLDTATLQTVPVIPGENSPSTPASVQWLDGGLIALSTGLTVQLYQLEGAK